ncbi:MAG TPA: thioredoxin family protein [Geothrix sp.]|uniref:thioredoxin family protein n=1 Tax=Geothrix mesophila TaxID=2922723 RepID=UPI001FAB62DD|nr:thioredoxin family protein [Geothrix sp. SG198]HJV37910.1 thioredoxin family protein [Geothrix sp.]
MPRPAILPTVDWQAVFDSGLTYAEWLAAAESPEQRTKIETQHRALALDPPTVGVLAALPRPVHVIAIAEDWCGDVVRHAPVLQRLAEAGPKLEVRYISRMQHPDVFARFLTNGGEAIPKFIFLSDRFVECGNWGPMPERCKELIARGKACGDVAAARKKVSVLYEQDTACHEVVAELMRLVDIASSREP